MNNLALLTRSRPLVKILSRGTLPIFEQRCRVATWPSGLKEEIKRHEERVITLPNALTFSRICTSPAIGYFILSGRHSEALACFAFAAATDLLDGFLARRLKQRSEVGAILDPIADKLLITTCLVCLCHTDVLPLWFVKGIISRDIVIMGGAGFIRYFTFKERHPGLKKYFDFKNYPTRGFEPTIASKCNTALLCFTIAVHLSTNHMVGTGIYDYAIWSLHGLNALFTVYSGAEYSMRVITKHPLTRI